MADFGLFLTQESAFKEKYVSFGFLEATLKQI